MILGSFDTRGRPYIQGRLFFPQRQRDAYVDFLVDTGADVTSLHPIDGLTMNLPYEDLEPPVPFGGIGGTAPYSLELGVLYLADGRFLRAFALDIAILNINALNTEAEGDIPTISSVLGRDVLGNGWMRYDPPNDRLEFICKTSDATVRATLGDRHSIQRSYHHQRQCPRCGSGSGLKSQ